MKKIVLIVMTIILAGLTYANANSYVNVGVGLYDARDSYNYDYDNEELYGISLGKYFKDKKLALELEINTAQFKFEDDYSTTDTTTTIVDNNDGTDAVIPRKPGNGIGYGWGWYRRNPPIPAVPSTQTTNTTTTTSVFSDGGKVRLTSALINAQYRLINKTRLTPYASVGCGLTYAQVDFDVGNDYSEYGFTYQGGLGIDLESINRKVAIGANVRYYHTMFEGDLDMYGLQYLVGLKFNL